MTAVTYDRHRHRLTLKGHAGFDKPGHDIVCAAMTILAYTYAAACINAAETGRADKDNVIADMQDGNIDISIKPKDDYDAVYTIMLDAICAGYTLLQNQYPAFIDFKVLG